jgi:hypothetical protein
VRSRGWRNAVRSAGPGGDDFGPSRRRVLAGGIGAGAVLALPDLGLDGRLGAQPGASDRAASRYAFLYGTPDPDPGDGSLVAAICPASHAASSLAPVPVAVKLAAAPVSSPDQALTAVATVDMVHDGATITVALLDATSAAVARRASVTVAGVPADANVLVTPVFAPGSAIISLVLAITKPVGKRLVRKVDPRTGRLATLWATT